MYLYSSMLLGSALLFQQGQGQSHQGHQGHGLHPIVIPDVPKNTSPVQRDFQSFSIEFSYFPDFAGNKSHPNEFSRALLENLEKITGVFPIIRVGGTTQDHSTYVPGQKENIRLIFQNPSDDQPKHVTYGPGFFESYDTLGDIKYIHGLNLNQSDPTHLETAAAQACKSLGDKLHLFELGNEFNTAPMAYRGLNYSMADYIHEWNGKSDSVKRTVQRACGGFFPGFMAPSFILLDGLDKRSLMEKLPVIGQGSMPSFVDTANTAENLFRKGYDDKNLTREFSFHHYMDLALPMLPAPRNGLQKTLMNHTNIVGSLQTHVERAQRLAYLGHPYILGETNSIGVQGRDGESNVFGDTLWLVDYSLWAAANNIKRLHFHQGLNYRYGTWQPIQTKKQGPATRAPYYGHIMVASAIGFSDNARVVNIPLRRDTESAYAIYDRDNTNDNNTLTKLVVTNLQEFNNTMNSVRPTRNYSFRVPKQYTQAKVDRLTAPGSDMHSNITFGGVSYDHDLKQGRPVVVDPKKEIISVQHGVLTVTLPDSSAVLLSLK